MRRFAKKKHHAAGAGLHSPSRSFQGYAYTFITEDQVRYAGDIIKALELSGSPVPADLEQLWASFKDQQKAVRQSKAW